MIKKKFSLILLVVLMSQPVRAMDEDTWNWRQVGVVVGISAVVGSAYFIYRTFTIPRTMSSRDIVALRKQCAQMKLRELQYTINEACSHDDIITLKEAVTCLIAKFNQKQLLKKYFESPEYFLQISRTVTKDKNVYAWLEVFRWYFKCGRFLTEAFSPNCEEQLKKNSTKIHMILRAQFLACVESFTDHDAIQKVIDEYHSSDSNTREMLLECAQIFGHKDELVERIDTKTIKNRCYVLVYKQKPTSDVTFGWH